VALDLRRVAVIIGIDGVNYGGVKMRTEEIINGRLVITDRGVQLSISRKQIERNIAKLQTELAEWQRRKKLLDKEEFPCVDQDVINL
jgi:C-terminal processing protease CtpA/Prc